MWEDPIVAEVHRMREKLAAKCDYDIEAIFAGSSEASGVRWVPGLFRKKNEPNQRLKLTGAAIPVLRGPHRPRRPRQLSPIFRRKSLTQAGGYSVARWTERSDAVGRRFHAAIDNSVTCRNRQNDHRSRSVACGGKCRLDDKQMAARRRHWPCCGFGTTARAWREFVLMSIASTSLAIRIEPPLMAEVGGFPDGSGGLFAVPAGDVVTVQQAEQVLTCWLERGEWWPGLEWH